MDKNAADSYLGTWLTLTMYLTTQASYQGGSELISVNINAPIELNVKMKIKPNVFFVSHDINQCLFILNPLESDDRPHCTFLFWRFWRYCWGLLEFTQYVNDDNCVRPLPSLAVNKGNSDLLWSLLKYQSVALYVIDITIQKRQVLAGGDNIVANPRIGTSSQGYSSLSIVDSIVIHECMSILM